ncbi:MAG: polysaccharide deacetylase family protein [Desulfarculaceae bacterium]|nr:polysaccharide deacetylase family protein [Desulfarculaceae bacterium]MCF8072251.1 polysaccharide deacetylase family protein [Desulfarculaceae bacterium]MCF8100172.1 polysaccharide deacetylase family protein [Desulfarculaceae bacterium]MCF8117884.1 polysaccharide deacetylase family protein [Desulfarculaceae bacterium]
MPSGQRQSAAGPTRLVLKVDIDTKVGLQEGVPRLLDIFARAGVKASIFVAMGPDHSGRALARLVKPGFLQKQLRSGAAGAYGLTTMLYGVALPGPIIAQTAPHLFREIMTQGHEAGLHGWDHVFWHDRMRHLPPSRLRSHLGRAWRLFKQITGQAPAAFASPGWQITPDGYAALAAMGITHASCVRGAAPFRPLKHGRALPLVELPTTMPTLDEVLGRGGVDLDNAAAHLAGQVRPGELNVFTLHGEVEGRAQAPVLRELIDRLQDQGVVFQRLVDAARDAAAAPLPVGGLEWGSVAGRAGEVAFQAGSVA